MVGIETGGRPGTTSKRDRRVEVGPAGLLEGTGWAAGSPMKLTMQQTGTIQGPGALHVGTAAVGGPCTTGGKAMLWLQLPPLRPLLVTLLRHTRAAGLCGRLWLPQAQLQLLPGVGRGRSSCALARQRVTCAGSAAPVAGDLAHRPCIAGHAQFHPGQAVSEAGSLLRGGTGLAHLMTGCNGIARPQAPMVTQAVKVYGAG